MFLIFVSRFSDDVVKLSTFSLTPHTSYGESTDNESEHLYKYQNTCHDSFVENHEYGCGKRNGHYQ